jgi:hypothetical protein
MGITARRYHIAVGRHDGIPVEASSGVAEPSKRYSRTETIAA